MTPPRRIVVLGMMTKIPVAGVVWQTLHYLLGLRRLGFEPHYVEAHARTPSMMMTNAEDDGASLAAAFIDRTLTRFDLGGQWAYQALHSDGRCYGMSERQLRDLYRSAELIINLHGGTLPREEHAETGRLVYLETDPVQLQLELAHGVPETIEFLEQHCAFFTFAENWLGEDCLLPTTSMFQFRPTRQPVCLDLWEPSPEMHSGCFTTVANWRQVWRDVTIAGRSYSWSKHLQFEKYLSLPERTGRDFELAVSGCDEADARRLGESGWRVRDGLELSRELDPYRSYIRRSLAEFTVAKEQNVALKSGWFSDRSATYLAAGRPVITQETGFSHVLPTGTGLFPFSTIDEAVDAVERVSADYTRCCEGALAVAREYFSSDVVLRELVDAVGVPVAGSTPRASALDPNLRLTPVARRPLRLPDETIEHVASSPLPLHGGHGTAPDASVVVVSHNTLPLTRLCVESVLSNTETPACELIVVDNGSTDGSRVYLRTIARRCANVQVLLEDANRGFPAACNIGLGAARGRLLVLLNSDTIVPPGWLARLDAHAAERAVGLVGPVTNRIGNEAEVAVGYESYSAFLDEARVRGEAHAGHGFDIAMPAMFCLALRRDVHERVGPLDEGFGTGLLEDDDYAERARRAGYRSVCAEDVLVHHFGEGSFGRLFGDGSHGRLLASNRRRFEEKWDVTWEPYERRQAADYELLRERVREIVSARLPEDTAVIVASRGDDELLSLPNHRGWHFPQTAEGIYAGHYPADSEEAIAALEELRARGGDYFLLPRTSLWWLEYYRELGAHLERNYNAVVEDDACLVFELNGAS